MATRCSASGSTAAPPAASSSPARRSPGRATRSGWRSTANRLHFRALNISADGGRALLGKPPDAGSGIDIYLVPVAGVRADTPKLLVSAALAATLLP